MIKIKNQKERSFWGRVFILGPFWSLCIYTFVVIFGSMLTTLYGRPPAFDTLDEIARVQAHNWCLRQLVNLRDQLESEVTHTLSRAHAFFVKERLNSFEQKWNQDFEIAAAKCGSEINPEIADAFINLRMMKQDYSEGIAKLIHARKDVGDVLNTRIKNLTTKLPQLRLLNTNEAKP
ncbi:MAG: hypothetical protein JW841_04430 [Deltaproteobacteria bacterium]|nr:hypothetical protein [Deltaproteobacteria bacterium]